MLPAFTARLAGIPETPIRRLGQLAVFAVLLGGSCLLAVIAWGFLPPPLAPAVEIERDPLAQVEGFADHLTFANLTPTSATTPGSLLLIGTTASADPRLARALIRREGENRLLILSVGDEVTPGLRVQRIERRQIVLSGSGGEQRLTLPQSPPQFTENPIND